MLPTWTDARRYRFMKGYDVKLLGTLSDQITRGRGITVIEERMRVSLKWASHVDSTGDEVPRKK